MNLFAVDVERVVGLYSKVSMVSALLEQHSSSAFSSLPVLFSLPTRVMQQIMDCR